MSQIILLLVLILAFSSQVFAKEGSNGDGEGEARREFRREERIEDGENRQRTEIRERVRILQGAVVPEQKVEIKENEFEITGTITSITDNKIIAAEEEIVIDPEKVSEFEQKGILALGNTVKVEGIIKDNTKFAEEITVFGTDLGNIRVKVENTEDNDKLIEVKARGPIDQIKTFLQQIGSFLNNLIT